MQSADGALSLLPALPDAWPAGSIRGLRARGGFEVTDMEWKEGRLVKVVVMSRLGGNLRLRVPNALVMGGAVPKAASGNNPNPFYQTEATPAPVVAGEAKLTAPELRATLVYDIPTKAGLTYTFLSK